ncbi:Troponin T [Armadillidium vulgare]|nr:Troponin T [Armadillidium vulgare]
MMEGGVRKFGMKGSGDKFSNIQAAKGELGKTKEQLAEEKKIALSIRVKPLAIDGLGQSALKSKADEMWQLIMKLETEKYDMEQRMERQDYDLKELRERQKQQLRQKALKKGLDPEVGKWFTLKNSKESGKKNTKSSLIEPKDILELIKQANEKRWAEQRELYESQHHARLPKWFGERPGKKGDTDSPEAEEVEEVEAPIPEPEPEPEEEGEEEEEKEEEKRRRRRGRGGEEEKRRRATNNRKYRKIRSKYLYYINII